MVTHPVIRIGAIRNNMNFSCAVCSISVISEVNMDRKLLLYYKLEKILKISYVRVINISYQGILQPVRYLVRNAARKSHGSPKMFSTSVMRGDL